MPRSESAHPEPGFDAHRAAAFVTAARFIAALHGTVEAERTA